METPAEEKSEEAKDEVKTEASKPEESEIPVIVESSKKNGLISRMFTKKAKATTEITEVVVTEASTSEEKVIEESSPEPTEIKKEVAEQAAEPKKEGSSSPTAKKAGLITRMFTKKEHKAASKEEPASETETVETGEKTEEPKTPIEADKVGTSTVEGRNSFVHS